MFVYSDDFFSILFVYYIMFFYYHGQKIIFHIRLHRAFNILVFRYFDMVLSDWKKYLCCCPLSCLLVPSTLPAGALWTVDWDLLGCSHTLLLSWEFAKIIQHFLVLKMVLIAMNIKQLVSINLRKSSKALRGPCKAKLVYHTS